MSGPDPTYSVLNTGVKIIQINISIVFTQKKNVKFYAQTSLKHKFHCKRSFLQPYSPKQFSPFFCTQTDSVSLDISVFLNATLLKQTLKRE